MIPRSQWPELIALGIGNLSAGVRGDPQPDQPARLLGICLDAMPDGGPRVGRPLVRDPRSRRLPGVDKPIQRRCDDSALLQVLLPIGLPPATILPGCDPVAGRHNLNPRTWPADWKELAAKYRAARGKFYDCPTFDHVGSALLSGWPVVMGVDWQGGGHALCRPRPDP